MPRLGGRLGRCPRRRDGVILTKRYWMEVSIGGYDADGNVDTKSEYAAGGQLNVNWTNEEIRSLLDVKMDYVMLQIERLRELEAEESRKAAEPFWRKWLGA
jgi:hypothetical protein